MGQYKEILSTITSISTDIESPKSKNIRTIGNY